MLSVSATMAGARCAATPGAGARVAVATVGDGATVVAPGAAVAGAVVGSTTATGGVATSARGKSIGVTTTTAPVSINARKKRLSISVRWRGWVGHGSNPPARNGWHRPMRFMASHDPRSAPWTSSASIA